MTRQTQPDWQLPEGVTRGLADYVASDHIADDYDEFFALNSLFDFDAAVIDRHFTLPGRIADFGCGTGRALVPLVRRGFQGLAIDLSPSMLRVVQEKADLDGLEIDLVQANLVELDALADEIVEYGLCMFSTLGMIAGRENRAKALRHMCRVLKPGGTLVLHVHNVWNNLFDPAGRRWLTKHLAQVAMRRDVQLGDKVMPYRGVPNMYLHTFTEWEIRRELERAGMGVVELIRLSAQRQRPLPRAWWLPRLRANGWIVIARRPTGFDQTGGKML